MRRRPFARLAWTTVCETCVDDRRRGLRGRTPARLRVGQDSRSGLATARALEKFADHASLRVAHGHQSRRGKLVPPRRNGGRTSAMLAWTIVGESCVGDCRRGLRGRSSATAPCRTGGGSSATAPCRTGLSLGAGDGPSVGEARWAR